ncbi:cell wall-binding repeat-containing protein [Clostridium sp. ATCC 25772]|uniref:cell wall-binding repeat-containing protein n=1 Tax=Clostridium sp. ATCC 25772 TaxID=1676991 RepID=UPI00078533B3|nr:cell wall-binding repeat-containing protein [Clostridium sp. ATCC 25772]
MKKLFKQKLSILLLFFSMFMFLLPVNASAKVNESRIYGSDRIETAIKISEQGWKSGSDYVFIAYGYDFADALSVTPLAKKYNSPIILSNKNGLTENAIKELQRLKPKKAFILGGERALSANVEAQIKKCSITETERIYGSTRYETALKVSEKLGTSDTIFISNGLSYADALSVATIAAQKESPILYTEKNNIPSKVTEYIKKVNISKAYFVGGTNVIDNTVVTGIKNSERIAGNDRYLTNKEVLSKFINYISYENVYFVRGNDFADALSISPIAGLKKAPIILTNNNLNSDVEKIINSNITSTSKLTIIGGEKVVPSSILDKIDSNFSQTKLSKDNETFGNVETIKEVRGDILVTGNNVTINNVKLNGNLILDPGEKGTVNIKGTTCKNVIVKSGDVNSINLTNVKSDNLVVESKSNVAVKLFEDSTIKNTEVKSNAILKNTKGDFGALKVTGTKESNYNIELEGRFDKEVLVNCSSNIKCDDVKNIKIDSKESNSKVTLKGKVTDINIINCSNTTLDGSISNVKIENSSQLTIDKNATVKKIQALDKSKITIKNGAKVNLIEKNKNVTISGNADKIVENNSDNGSGGSSSSEKPKNDEFKLIISNDGNEILNKNLKVDSKKTAMEYLKENADIKTNNGFINEINKIKSKPLKKLSESERKQGYLGADWFIYLNGKKTPVGANDVFVKSGDKLELEYRFWDWHDLVAPGDPMELLVDGINKNVKENEDINIVVTCVNRPVYGATIKVDDKEVSTTNIDGEATIKISSAGKHTISVLKEGVKVENQITVSSNNQGGGTTEPPKDGDDKDDGINETDKEIQLSKDNVKFGDESKIKEVNKDIVVKGNNIEIRNIKLNGNLILDPGEKGTVNIKGTTCKNVIVKSGDVNSINLTNVKSDNLTVESKSNVSVKLFEDSKIKGTEIKSNAILKNTKGDFGAVKITGSKDSNYDIAFEGTFDKEILVNCPSKIKCEDVKNIKIGSKEKDSEKISKVILNGKIDTLKVRNCSDTVLYGTIAKVKVENSSQLKIEKTAVVENIEAIEKSKVNIEDGAKVNLVEKHNDVILEGKPNEVTELKFTFVIKNEGKEIFNKTLELDTDKSALQYLRENADSFNQDSTGLICEINGIKNKNIKELTSEQLEKGIFGMDWFIYLNGNKTPVGAPAVFMKNREVLSFEFREWNWCDLYSDDYKGKPELIMEMYGGNNATEVKSDQNFMLVISCVNKPVYGAKIKIDGKEVESKTDRDGVVENLSIHELGTHTITAEQYGASVSKEITVMDPSVIGSSKNDKYSVVVKNIKEDNIEITLEDINKNSNSIATIKIMDRRGDPVYLDQDSIKNGKCKFNTVLGKGKFIVCCNVDGILIDFRINIK